jgi:hypothetical protein
MIQGALNGFEPILRAESADILEIDVQPSSSRLANDCFQAVGRPTKWRILGRKQTSLHIFVPELPVRPQLLERFA